MPSGKRWTVLTWARDTESEEMGIPAHHVKMLEEQFDLIWEKDIEKNPELGVKVDAALIAPLKPVKMITQRAELFPNMKAVASFSIGMDHVDLDSLRQRGIRFGVTEYFTDSTAEQTLLLLLAVSRDLNQWQYLSRNPSIKRNILVVAPPGLYGTTVGIVGIGRIGLRLAELLQPHHVTLIYTDIYRRSAAEEKKLGLTYYATVHEMIPHCDYISIHCPLTDQSCGLFSDREFEMMKPTASLINAARGQVVDTEALLRALQSGKLRAAGLDVTDPEPFPQDHPLQSMPNVIITPHCAALTTSSGTRAFQCCIGNILGALEGKEMTKEIKL